MIQISTDEEIELLMTLIKQINTDEEIESLMTLIKQINTDKIRSYPFNQFYQCIYP